MNTDQYFADPRRVHRLYRDKRRGMIFGVCAGLADYFAFDLRVTRILTVDRGDVRVSARLRLVRRARDHAAA